MTHRILTAGRATDTAVGLTTLVLSAGTLVCCALPLLMVSLGLGASVAALTSAAPWLVALSAYKGWTFALAGLALVLATFLRFRPGRTCPSDPHLAALCGRADRWNNVVLAVAGSFWVIGFAVAFLWLPVRRWLGV